MVLTITSIQGIINASVVFFALAVIFGIIVLATLFKQRNIPKQVAYIHGSVALLGLLLMIIFVIKTPGYYPVASLVLFVLAAVGGIYLFTNDMRGKAGPVWFAPIHATLALIAFVLLIIFVAG